MLSRLLGAGLSPALATRMSSDGGLLDEDANVDENGT